jgi:hypothetical protein
MSRSTWSREDGRGLNLRLFWRYVNEMVPLLNLLIYYCKSTIITRLASKEPEDLLPIEHYEVVDKGHLGLFGQGYLGVQPW